MSSPRDEHQPAPLHERLTRRQRTQILFAVAIGTFMGPLDSSIINIALPNITGYFHSSLASVEWVIMAYLLIISSLLLTFGRLGDMYGHKRIYIMGFVIFTLGSLLCATAPSLLLLVIFRIVQAVGAGMLMSMGPAIVTDITPPKERGKALGVIAVSVSVALLTGPILGGILTDKFGWPSVFFVNVPVGILALALAAKVIPRTQGHGGQRFDIAGAMLLFTALVAILFPLSYAEKVGWMHFYIIGSLVVGVILLILFVILESRIEDPMVDLTLFRNRLFSLANLSALLNYIALFATVLIMPFYLQQLRGMSPSQAGLMLIPMPLATMVIAPISGSLSDRVDTRYISSLGMGVVAFGLWLLSNLTIDSSQLAIITAMGFVGFGSGMFQTPNNSAVMGAVPPNRRGIASSLLASMRNIGMVLGAAIAGAVFTNKLGILTRMLSSQGLTGAQLKIQAFTGAMHLTYHVATGVAVMAILTSLVRGPMGLNAKQ